MTLSKKPPRPRLSAKFAALQRKQLDAKLSAGHWLLQNEQPRDGWIRTIRSALGMTAVQLAKRLGMSPQAVFDLERREATERITVATLKTAAHALNCEVFVAFIPKTSLEQTVLDQAKAKAGHERDRVVHTMRLEAQDEGVAVALGENENVESWLTTRAAHLWD
jgi:predicted DNA-binding mobile mystery protein A